MIAQCLVLLYQIQSDWLDGGLNHLTHELLMRQLGGFCPFQAHRFSGKSNVVMNVENARLVISIKRVISGFERGRIRPTNLQTELAPCVIGIKGEQGVIEIEQCQSHVLSNIDLIKGMVMALCVCNAN